MKWGDRAQQVGSRRGGTSKGVAGAEAWAGRPWVTPWGGPGVHLLGSGQRGYGGTETRDLSGSGFTEVSSRFQGSGLTRAHTSRLPSSFLLLWPCREADGGPPGCPPQRPRASRISGSGPHELAKVCRGAEKRALCLRGPARHCLSHRLLPGGAWPGPVPGGRWPKEGRPQNGIYDTGELQVDGPSVSPHGSVCGQI